MADAKVLNVRMELRLELMAVIRSDFADAERELFDDMIREIDPCLTGECEAITEYPYWSECAFHRSLAHEHAWRR